MKSKKTKEIIVIDSSLGDGDEWATESVGDQARIFLYLIFFDFTKINSRI
jgi:hypothetical protein